MSARFMMEVRCPKCRKRARLTEEDASRLGDGTEARIACNHCGLSFHPSGGGEPSAPGVEADPTAGPVRAEPPFRGLVEPERDTTTLPPFGAIELTEPTANDVGGNQVSRWWKQTSQRRRKQLVAVGMIVMAGAALFWPGGSEVKSGPQKDGVPAKSTPSPGKSPGPQEPPPRREPVLISREVIGMNRQVTKDSMDEMFDVIFVDIAPSESLANATDLMQLHSQRDIPAGQIIHRDMFGKDPVPNAPPPAEFEQTIVNGQTVQKHRWLGQSLDHLIRARDEADAERIRKALQKEAALKTKPVQR